jgi:hypothetical protein
MAQYGHNYGTISKKSGVSVPRLQNWARFRIVPNPIKDKIRSGEIKDTTTLSIHISATSQQTDEEKTR